jgi:hypothetical protein
MQCSNETKYKKNEKCTYEAQQGTVLYIFIPTLPGKSQALNIKEKSLVKI